MKLSEKWLREWVNPLVDHEQLMEKLTMAGLEVNYVKLAAQTLEKGVVGEIISQRKYSDFDCLSICCVDVGEKKPLEIICKASNVRKGLKVAVIPAGGVIGNLKVKKNKFRGVTSNWMICSERAIGLSDRNEEIVELPADAPIGASIQKYLELCDYIFDIKLTSNRGDCASVYGIAREIGAINRLKVKVPKLVIVSPVINDTFPVKIKTENLCPRYIGRVIRNINNHLKTPFLIRERLCRSGLCAIHPVVDIMNYVMLELGQPIHAFDLNQLAESIEVRLATADEKILLINGTKISLTSRALVIADKNQVQALAGIMGSAVSSVKEKTTDVFLESAYFLPDEIAVTARHYDIQTHSSYRFGRGISFKIQILAMERATELLIKIVGGSPGPIIEQCNKTFLPKILKILLRRDRIKRILGIEIEDHSVKEILESLGMVVMEEKHGWFVVVPSYRFDIKEEVDLIEELARLYGYHRIPQLMLEGECTISPISETQLTPAHFRRLMVDRSYNEVVTYSFVSDWLQFLLNPDVASIALSNPITTDTNVMRTSLWPGLINVLKHNQAYQIQRVRLFEIGMCFKITGSQWRQEMKLGGLVTGNAHSLQWAEKERLVDFYDLKGDISMLFSLTRRSAYFRFVPTPHPALHPGQSTALYYQNRCIGYLGALHPELIDRLALTTTPYFFEVELDAINTTMLPKYCHLPQFPSVRRDIAIIIDRDVPVMDIEKEISVTAGQLLIATKIFDVYEDSRHIEFGEKSVALGLTFYSPSRTLIDEEVREVVERVLISLKRKFNAKLREIV